MDECTLDGGVPFLNKCFKEMNYVETIEEARQTCILQNKSLLLLDSVQETSFMDDLIKYGNAWVGATYNKDDYTILWDDGKLMCLAKYRNLNQLVIKKKYGISTFFWDF